VAFDEGVMEKWLDGRRAGMKPARGRQHEELVAQRARANPRLPKAWITYLVNLGARQEDRRWYWKHDRKLGAAIVGPHPSQWMLPRLLHFPIPLLAFFSTVKEPVSWD